MLTATHTAMGYQATMADGVLTVHRVPIFCACEKDDFVADEAWIRKAVTNGLALQRGAYMPPLHARHHEPSTDANDAVIPAGFFKILGAEPITLKGARRTAILADLIITNPGVQHDVLAMRYPYRSVEIFDIEADPVINGLALLDHEAPFLELPMLMVSGVDEQGAVADATFRQPWSMTALPNSGPVLACLRRGKRADLLFREETDMTTTTETPAVDPKQPTLFEDDTPKKDDDKDEGKDMEGEGLDVSAVVKAIESGEISVADMDAILAAIQAQGSTKPEEQAPEVAAPAAAPGAEAMSRDPVNMAIFARMQGQIDGLQANDKARDDTDVRKTDVSDALKRLEGRPLGADLEGKLVKFHKDHGPKAFTPYVDALAQTVAPLPGADGRAEAFLANSGKVPDVAMKYQEQGTEAVDRAANFARQWKHLNERGGMRTTLERYVEINMETAQEIPA